MLCSLIMVSKSDLRFSSCSAIRPATGTGRGCAYISLFPHYASIHPTLRCNCLDRSQNKGPPLCYLLQGSVLVVHRDGSPHLQRLMRLFYVNCSRPHPFFFLTHRTICFASPGDFFAWRPSLFFTPAFPMNKPRPPQLISTTSRFLASVAWRLEGLGVRNEELSLAPFPLSGSQNGGVNGFLRTDISERTEVGPDHKHNQSCWDVDGCRTDRYQLRSRNFCRHRTAKNDRRRTNVTSIRQLNRLSTEIMTSCLACLGNESSQQRVLECPCDAKFTCTNKGRLGAPLPPFEFRISSKASSSP